MKRQWKILLCLLLVLITLSGCAGNQNPQVFDEVTQYIGLAITNTPVTAQTADPDQSVFASNPYDVDPGDYTESDAMGEENYGDTGGYDNGYSNYSYWDENATVYPYAGSTPIPLDPVDMPSATPRQELVFAYVPYVISTLGLTFDGPAGWMPDESISEQFTLTEPEAQKKGGQLGIIKIYAVPVNSNYSEANLKTEVLDRLNSISSTNYAEWKPSLTASRYLMGGKGVYANYSGTLANGVKLGGRIHCTCIEKVLYCIEIVYPLDYKDDYLNAFSKMRETIKRQ